MILFVVEYVRPTGTLRVFRHFPETEYAAAAKLRFELDLANRERPEIETVLLGSDSLKTLKYTHGRYFHKTTEAAAQAIADLEREGA